MSDTHPTGPCYTCPKCGMTSYHPKDVEHRYCGRCHDWTENYLSVWRERVMP